MIEIRNLTKSFRRYADYPNTLKALAMHPWHYRRQRQEARTFNVIEDLNLTIEPGEVFCLVGTNGCGKSTLAKLIAGTMTPDQGVVIAHGKVVPYLELGVAFAPELTGRDNVMLNGILLGLTRRYLRQHMDEIFEFAGIQGRQSTPLKFYSSGMTMRLAFSIGLHVDGDIYIFDEILSVGDALFGQKCEKIFQQKLREKKTIVHVTHDMSFVREHATVVLLMKRSGYQVVRGRDAIQSMFVDASVLHS